jgi:hypothetical protein
MLFNSSTEQSMTPGSNIFEYFKYIFNKFKLLIQNERNTVKLLLTP